MSILNFPRIHFQGSARIHAPTGYKNGFVDLSTNTVYINGERFDHRRPVSDYHEYLDNIGSRFNGEGQWDKNGAFNTAKGWDFGGNGHFSIEAKVISTQRQFGEIDQHDLLVGCNVDFWGHFNDYLGTTFNRARIFDCDPASNWTTTIMLGHMTFGRQDRSHEVPNMFSAPVEGMQPARWQNFNYIHELPEHCLNKEFKYAAVHQFTISKQAKDFLWGEESSASPTVSLLREAMNREDVLGIVVQFSLSNMSAPVHPDSPTFWELHGSIGLWLVSEMSTYPSGRLLTQYNVLKNTENRRGLSNLTVLVSPLGVSLNMITAVPCVGRAAKPELEPIHKISSKLDIGDLELCTIKNQLLVARIPKELYQLEAHQLSSGIVDVPLAEPFEKLQYQIEQQSLCIVGIQPDGQKQVLLQEQEVNIQVDNSCIFLEFPNWKHGENYAVELKLQSFVRGCPQAVNAVYLQQFYNPRGLPQMRYKFEQNPTNTGKVFHFPSSSELNIVNFKPGKLEDEGDFAHSCVVSTDEQGCGWVTLHGIRSGTTRVLLSVVPDVLPCDPKHPDEAIIAYDNDDLLGFWSGVGSFAIRVLPNDWHLLEVEDEAIDFNFIYEHILAYYELCFSFMKAEVFSLADRCKVENYARLMWQMCDPANKDKTYYMPPTRELSKPKALLMRQFLYNQQRVGYVPSPAPIPKLPQRTLHTRDELVMALRHAAELEMAIMLQYIYAAYSIPNYITGLEYVNRGLWTKEQLDLACGDGKEIKNYGMRGILLEISHEEMIHFLMVNNILMAIGEPFYPGIPDFHKINYRFPIEVDFALEPFNPSTVNRFIRFEWPDSLVDNLTNEEILARDSVHKYGSVSELYNQIREGIKNIPNLFVVKKSQVGGEHHLFLREDFNKSHPDYQLQVDDVKSALFAIDIIVEQGEGCNQQSSKREQSHFEQFLRMAKLLAQQHVNDDHTNFPVPWNPAYPVLRNPTLNYRDSNTSIVTAPETRAVMEIFNDSYFLMMQLMVQHFGLMPNASLRRSKLMNAAIDVMTGMMRPLGELLMTMPSGKRGKTAGPSFEIETPTYIPTPEVAYQVISSRFEKLAYQARECKSIHNTVCDMFDFYMEYFKNMANNSTSK